MPFRCSAEWPAPSYPFQADASIEASSRWRPTGGLGCLRGQIPLVKLWLHLLALHHLLILLHLLGAIRRGSSKPPPAPAPAPSTALVYLYSCHALISLPLNMPGIDSSPEAHRCFSLKKGSWIHRKSCQRLGFPEWNSQFFLTSSGLILTNQYHYTNQN
jgi:hypothetical protein